MKNDAKTIDVAKLSDALKVKSNVKAGALTPVAPIAAPHPCWACGLTGAPIH